METNSSQARERRSKRKRSSIKSNASGDAVDAPVAEGEGDSPRLSTVPKTVLIRICAYLFEDPEKDPTKGGAAFASLHRTCSRLRDMLCSDVTWQSLLPILRHEEYQHQTTLRERFHICGALNRVRQYQEGTESILLECLGGAEGVRRVFSHFIRYFICPPPFFLRGDTIYYLVHVIEGYMIEKLEKTHLMVIEQLRPGDRYPEIRAKDLRLLDRLSNPPDLERITRELQDWECNDEQLLRAEGRRKIVRALAYRAGIIRMDGEAFTLIANDILKLMHALLTDAYYECCTKYDLGRSLDELEPKSDTFEPDTQRFDYFATHYPPYPLKIDGRTQVVMIPNDIKSTALRCGVKPLSGFGIFGSEWAPSKDRTCEEEVKEALAQYYPEEDGVEYEVDESQEESDESSISSFFEDEQ